jgi:tetratricopeptide (TPR) repeat protein
MQASIDMIKAGRGEIPASIDDYQKQLGELEAAGDLSGQAEVLAALAGSYTDRCQWELALSSYKESLELFGRTGELYNRAQVIFNMALVHKDRGDLARAETMFTEALNLFQNLDAVPCIALAKLNLGTILGQMGQLNDSDVLFCEAIALLEGLGALPDLCEGYLAAALFKIREGRSLEGRFYLSRAETLISRTDYQPLKILLYNTQGELYQKDALHTEAESCFEKALSLARRLSNLLEEAKAMANLGRLALARRDYAEALVRLQKALSTFIDLGALFDVITLYHDLTSLFLAQEDYARAEEMAILRQRQARMLGYADLNIKALADLAECEAHTGRKEEARADYISALHMAWNEKDRFPSAAFQEIAGKAIDFLETAAIRPEEGHQASLLREKLEKGDYEELLEQLPGQLDCCKKTG